MMKEYIFKYLDKRYPLIGNEIHMQDNSAADQISLVFGKEYGQDIFDEWIKKFGKTQICIVFRSGAQQWLKNGEYHREDGPAMIYTDGHKEWWVNGKRHREDGPAVIYSGGDEYWYLNGERKHK